MFLALILPPKYVTSRWRGTSVGFDIALVSALAATAWLAWRRYQAAVVAALIVVTLLTTDAWFDIMTSSSNSDLLFSILTALVVELPMAALLFLVGYCLLAVASRPTREASGEKPPS